MSDPTTANIPAPAKSKWDRVGSIFASIAKGAASIALWASEHPEVVGAVVKIAQAKR